ncbi:hypothetical protein [Yinghuangia seranimata]|uniref:hypothetical protein n=1 Tax=Yinghuangia seranimata TaxID=408067 RepID=UPI00248C3063|nr:hypothetical protein [Yinghuangia seranimata]MDI2130664.1 hypothetical protein [Yinghuangia seranimata]
MDDFNGTATILADGASYDCKATLHHAYNGRAGGPAWGGELSVDEPDVVRAVRDAAEPHLRLDGGGGPFTVVEVDGDRVLRVAGTGPVPWAGQTGTVETSRATP